MTRVFLVAGCVLLLALIGCPRNVPEGGPAPGPAPVDAGTPQSCIQPRPPPTPELPWKDVQQLCERAPRGAPWPQALPVEPTEEAYALRVQGFLRAFSYRQAPYAWLSDSTWRMTGPYEGCPPNGINKGPHPAVRIYYSPQVIDWLCRYRRGEHQLPNAPPMPDGAMIIKEMINPDLVNLALIPGSRELWIAPKPGQPADWYDQNLQSWTVMIKDSRVSADGWYWAYFDRTSQGNPPFWDRAAFTTRPYPGSEGEPVTRPPGSEWYPTYWGYSVPDVQYPNAQAGNYCVYCHASSQGQGTFSSFRNLLGQEIRYTWEPAPSTPHDVEEHERAASAPAASVDAGMYGPFPAPREAPLPGFSQTFPQLNPRFEEVWASRLPSRTWDHVPSKLGVKGVPPGHSTFLTSDQCEGCHEAGGSGQLQRPYMVELDGSQQVDLSPFAEWSASPMGLAGRDPVFHAQLELERNLAREQPELSSLLDCIDNTCLHCHGAPGARQYNIDTAGQGPKDDRCKAFLPPKAERPATDYNGRLFTHDMVMAWRDERPELARYGGLARDGVNCTICHHVADKDLDPQNLPRTFTGNFRVGPPGTLYGPFPNPDSPEPVRTRPMEYALGITPQHGAQVARSELCGTCHTVYLPVFNQRGQLTGAAYEQTTYLEWLLSSFTTAGNNPAAQSCQQCHMPHNYKEQALNTGIANIQDTRYPEADFLRPAPEVDIPRRPYNRHALYGLNAFLNAWFQQFPLLLGYRQQDYMNGNVRAPLLTARETVLEVAREETAEVVLEQVGWQGEALEARVVVRNLGGHSLPSGVGFRRLFLELLVLGEGEEVLWASGRTNEVGVILEGTTARPLPTEFWGAGPGGLPLQPHHQVITSGAQVQIYEEATQDEALQFTSSFLHRYWGIKDNRLRPRGWSPARVSDPALREEYYEATRPGQGPEQNGWPRPSQPRAYRNPRYPALERYTDTRGDPDYELGAHGGQGLPGSDSVLYRVSLTPEQRAAARRIQLTLYSQSTPPSYLQERFAQAARPGAERTAAQRLYYMASHLNTAAVAEDGKPYLQGFKLRVGHTAERPVPAR